MFRVLNSSTTWPCHRETTQNIQLVLAVVLSLCSRHKFYQIIKIILVKLCMFRQTQIMTSQQVRSFPVNLQYHLGLRSLLRSSYAPTKAICPNSRANDADSFEMESKFVSQRNNIMRSCHRRLVYITHITQAASITILTSIAPCFDFYHSEIWKEN